MKNEQIRSESEIQKEILEILRAKNIKCWRMPLGSVKHGGVRKCHPLKGFPDIFGFVPNTFGQLFGIEVKRVGGKLSTDQTKWMEIFGQSNAIHIVATSFEEVINGFRKNGIDISTTRPQEAFESSSTGRGYQKIR